MLRDFGRFPRKGRILSMGTKSPLAPDTFPSIPHISGMRIAGAACGLKYKGRKDVLLAEFQKGTRVAGLFTQSKTAAAPVLWCRRVTQVGRARALIVNSGIANAATELAGEKSLQRILDGVSSTLNVPRSQVLMASTGVIGEILPHQKITRSLSRLKSRLGPQNWNDAAAAIMTTDTFCKGAYRRVAIGDTTVTIGGIAKGSGMIAPNMATMLSFLFTDAKIPVSVLRTLLRSATDRSFNAITVDGDTSTSDMVFLFSTGTAKHADIDNADVSTLINFRTALEEVMIELAHQIVRDGEGATKFVTVNVVGAASARAAKCVGFAIANSPLVKTAIAGEDPNWGRIVMAIGKSGETIDPDRLHINIGGISVAKDGIVAPDYEETLVVNHMKTSEIEIDINLCVGRGSATVWTCDLTHDYVSINADYRS